MLLTLWIEWSMVDEEVHKARAHLGRALDGLGETATADQIPDDDTSFNPFAGVMRDAPLGAL